MGYPNLKGRQRRSGEIVIALLTIKYNDEFMAAIITKVTETVCAVGVIAVSFLVERTIGCETGIIQSNCDIYPVPCYIWTALFGVVFGYIYAILRPVLFSERRLIHLPIEFSLIIGFNWILFNSFIGLIMKGTMPGMLLRSGLDVIVLFIASYIVERYVIRDTGV